MVWVKEDDAIVVPGKGNPISPQKITGGVQGRVLDEKNNPVAGAQVLCGSETSTTDSKGAFIIPKVAMIKEAAVITVKKAGYFNGVRTFVATGDSTLQYVQLSLLPKKTAGSFDAATGGLITGSNCQMIFLPQQILSLDNKPYNGQVNVLFAPISPDQPNFRDIMPGDLRGINNNNQQVGLQSFGMMAVELEGKNGEKLKLDGSKPVTFSMNIPASLISSAPATIPLWYFDESIGIWREEGSATKTGGSYIGSVKHFSFWNCDAPFPVVDFKATFTDMNGIPLSNVQVKIARSNGAIGYGYTNDKGIVTGKVPSNEKVFISLTDPCNKPFNEKEIGPFNGNTDLGIIKVTIPTAGNIQFNGEVTDCNNAPVKKGEVNISISGVTYRAITDSVTGKYAVNALFCATGFVNATLLAVDRTNNKMSAPTKLDVTAGTYIQPLVACDAIQPNRIQLVVDGRTFNYSQPADSIELRGTGNNMYSFSGRRKAINTDPAVYWMMNNLSTGTRTPYSFNVVMPVSKYFQGRNISCTITKTGGIGEYVEGTFAGNMSDSTSTVPVSGNFRILITN